MKLIPLTAREIAEETLPLMPSTEVGVLKLARREHWEDNPSFFRKRSGTKAFEFHYRLLPTLAQITYVQRYMIAGRIEPLPQSLVRAAIAFAGIVHSLNQ